MFIKRVMAGHEEGKEQTAVQSINSNSFLESLLLPL
jgi:hypothetical protein